MEKNVYNESKLAFHEAKLQALLEGKVTSPVYLRVKPTNKCNHHCFYCGYEEDDSRSIMDRGSEIPFDKMIEILFDFKDIDVKAVTYSGGGEPLIYPHITETLRRTLEFEIDLSMITNGQKLSGENADLLTRAKWVRISSDASDAKTFAETRKVPEAWFSELTENIRNFAKIKNPACELGVNFVVHKRNVNSIYKSVKHFKELATNHIKITPAWRPNFLEYHKDIKDVAIEQIEKARQELSDDNFTVYDTYEKDFAHCGINKREYKRCLIMQIVPVIGADCNVYFCHDHAYSPKGVLGSIKNRSFRDLWFSEETNQVFLEFNAQERCQRHCANDTKNLIAHKILDDISNLEKYKPKSDKHKNFI